MPQVVAQTVSQRANRLILLDVRLLHNAENSCLNKCRTPMGFLMTEWRPGMRGAFVMGLRHGAFCTGCCAMLMLLLFVLGVMNLVWIIVLTLVVLAEKLVLAENVWPSRMLGAGLIAWGGYVLLIGQG